MYWAIFDIKFVYSCVLKCVPILCLVFFILPKTPFSIFTSQKRSQISREYICRPLSIGVWIEKINTDIHGNIQHNFLISQFLFFSIKYYNFKICNKISLLINHGIWNWPIFKTWKKIESDLTTYLILLWNFQLLHIFTTSWMKTLTLLVKYYSLQIHILAKFVL